MDGTELETALEELETRLERLRSLYEQYFLGIEKVPPAVARTDVERRIWALRKEQIHNTAKRFKLQTIVQRFNTFQQYWQRICREIENGTYSPHLARARKKASESEPRTIMARRRLGAYSAEARKAAADQADQAVREAEAEIQTALAAPEPLPTAELLPEVGPQAGGQPPVGRRLRPPLKVPGARQAKPPASAKQAQAPTAEAPTADGSPARRTSNAGARPATPRAAPVREASARPSPGMAPRPGAVGPRPGPKPAALPPSDFARLDDRRVTEIHRDLMAARQRNHESTNVSVADLKRRLQATERQLRGQYRDRSIDFCVVTKNGRAIIKPIVR